MDMTPILLAQEMTQNSIIEGSVFDNQYLNPDYLFSKEVSFFSYFNEPTFFSGTLDLLHGIFYFLAIFFLTIIFYCWVRMFEIRKKEHAHLHHEIEEYAHHQMQRERKIQEGEAVSTNPRWVTTLNYIFSHNESDWKLAVIEADAMLEQLMGQLGFKGATLGEKLKGADQGNFRSLTNAWEVHTIRNRIAHEGLAFPLSNHEAKRVIAIYESIFRQYGFI